MDRDLRLHGGKRSPIAREAIVSRWITVDLWGLISDHPWWTGFIAVHVTCVSA
jgi:hypothetical protein